MKEVISKVKSQLFVDEEVLVLATGGFAVLFEKENIYDHLLPDLVLEGLRLAMQMNG